MAQVRVNGAVASDQFLTAELSHFILDEVDGSANIADFGFDGSGDPKAGEAALQAIQTVANPVIVESSNARVLFFAVENDGHVNTDFANAVNSLSSFANATVTAGSYNVV